jgi:cytochrome c oxidase subunit 2
MTEFLQQFMPVVSSEMGHLGDNLSGLVHWLMLVLFVGWGVFFIVALIKFRSSNNPEANYHGITNHYSSYVEGAVVAVEALLLIGFAIPGYYTVKYDKIIDTSSDEIEVRVIAQQFAWNIHYPGLDGKFGITRANLVNEEVNPIGLDREGSGADDIVTLNQLHLPVDKLIKIYISSKDVIHGFSLPEMRVKQDAVPGMQIPVYFTPTMTTNEFLQKMKGTSRENMGYEIACAQLCGNSHYRMKGYMTIHNEDEYNQWLLDEAELLDSEGNDEWDDEW